MNILLKIPTSHRSSRKRANLSVLPDVNLKGGREDETINTDDKEELGSLSINYMRIGLYLAERDTRGGKNKQSRDSGHRLWQ
jgi:hypothetical protein